MIGEAVTQDRLATQRASPLSNNPSYQQYNGYSGFYSNYPDTGYHSGENQRGAAQSNDRQSQHMQHPASEGFQDIGHDTQAQDGFLIALLPVEDETISTSQDQNNMSTAGLKFSFTYISIDLIESFLNNPPPELFLLLQGVVNSKQFEDEKKAKKSKSTCIGMYIQTEGGDANVNFRTSNEIDSALLRFFNLDLAET